MCLGATQLASWCGDNVAFDLQVRTTGLRIWCGTNLNFGNASMPGLPDSGHGLALGFAHRTHTLLERQPMDLAPLRFAKIEGTAVSVTVTSAQEAKAALKELRHKKRELKFLRSALLKRQKAAQPKRPRKAKQPKSGFQTFIEDVRWGLSAIVDQGVAPLKTGKQPAPAAIDAELRRIDETLHNIEGCILQLQGKLLTRG
jgi:hypothetical protein